MLFHFLLFFFFFFNFFCVLGVYKLFISISGFFLQSFYHG
jgi:hypothetical protein